MSKRFYITTAIDYVNGQPHLGHAYEKVIADVIARSRRSLGQEVFFLTGLDEHGQKVQQAALAQGKTPQAYCDELAAVWRRLPQKLELTNDDFVRTTAGAPQGVGAGHPGELHAEGQFYKKIYSRLLFRPGGNIPDGKRPPARTARLTRPMARSSSCRRRIITSGSRITSSG